MTTRLYYGYPRPRGIEPPELTREDLPPDGDFYCDPETGEQLPVSGIRLTREPNAWWRTALLITVDVPLDEAALARYRLQWDRQHESYDLPVDLVNASQRRWVRDAETVGHLMQMYCEDECGDPWESGT